jgi:chromosome segregation protein
LDFIKKESLKGGIFAIKSEPGTGENKGLSEVVSGQFSNILKKELSKYNFAETIEEALKKSKEKGGFWVTKNGDVINDNFIILSKDKKGILTRRAKERELSLEQNEYETRLKKLEEKRTGIIDAIDQLKNKLEYENIEREKLVNTTSEFEFEISRAELKLETIEKKINDTKKEIEEIKKTIAEEDKEKENVKKALSLSSKRQEELKEEKEKADGELKKVGKIKETISGKENEIRDNIGKLKEGLRLIQRKENLKKEIEELTVIIDKETKKLEDLKTENTTLYDEIQKNEKILDEKKIEQASTQDSKSNMEKELSDLKMGVSEEKYKKNSLQNEIFKEFGVEISGEKVEIGEEIFESIDTLKRRIEALYPINPLALTQYEEKQKELDKLEAERADLLSSKKDIEETIQEIDAKATKEFEETILSIKEDFKSIYSKLSPGGEADIRLPSSNILESDIEILVRPRGKKLKNMELFSTGEKTLAAVALLLSVMRKRQSPIYIMDEIDAPLDENNIERFNDIMREFAETSQILIVTHNRATMEHSDFIYGITMQEAGVSTALSIELDKV